MFDDFDVLNDLDQLSSRYQVLRRLGDDGGCAVYAVRGREPDRHYVVKVMPKPGAGSAQAGTLHLWQAHTMERLDHPRLMVLHTVHHLQGGKLALAMERLRGPTLTERIGAEGPMPIAAVERVVVDVGAALSYLHARGVIHRGVSLDSILVDQDGGYARLAHFGIPKGGRAATRREDAQPPVARAEPGCPALPAEPARPLGSDGDAREDLHRLGLVAYAMLTGGETPLAPEPLPPLETLRPDAPPHLLRAIAGCLHPDSRRRWRKAEELLAAMDPAAEAAAVDRRADRSGVAARRLRAAASAIAELAADRPRLRLRPPRLALALPVALIVLVVWAAPPRGDEDAVARSEPGGGSAVPAAVGRTAPEAAPLRRTGLPDTLASLARAAAPPGEAEQPKSRPADARERRRAPVASSGSGGPREPVRRAPLPTLLGEELASARRQR